MWLHLRRTRPCRAPSVEGMSSPLTSRSYDSAGATLRNGHFQLRDQSLPCHFRAVITILGPVPMSPHGNAPPEERGGLPGQPAPPHTPTTPPGGGGTALIPHLTCERNQILLCSPPHPLPQPLLGSADGFSRFGSPQRQTPRYSASTRSPKSVSLNPIQIRTECSETIRLPAHTPALSQR